MTAARAKIQIDLRAQDFTAETVTSLWATLLPLWDQQISTGKRSPDSRTQAKTAASRWTEFWSLIEAPALKAGASEPPVNGLRARIIDAWLDWVQAVYGCSNRSLNKYSTCIRSIVRESTDGELEFPKTKKRAETPETHATWIAATSMARLYTACDEANWPDCGLPFASSAYWRAVIVMIMHYGFRTQELVAYSSQKNPLTWSAIHWPATFPGVGNAKQNPHGWIRYTPEKQRRKKSRPLVLPMTGAVVSHLRSIEPLTPDPAAKIFPFPLCRVQLDRQWERITAAAGLGSHAGHSKLLIKHLRSNCGSWHDKIRDGMGDLVLGHAQRSVTARHYIQAAPKLIRQFEKFPCPEIMQSAKSEIQLRIF